MRDSTIPIIEAVELRRNFKGNEAVAGVSLTVHRGEIFGFLGPNSAGKTTIIRLLTGQIDSGGGRTAMWLRIAND
jgi:ABC-type multidrug transport system ATPase subunit